MGKYFLRYDNGVIGLIPISLVGIIFTVMTIMMGVCTGLQLFMNVVVLIFFSMTFVVAIFHSVMARNGKVYIKVEEERIVKHLWSGKEYIYEYCNQVIFKYYRNKKTLKGIVLFDENGRRCLRISNSYDISLEKTKNIIVKKKG